MTSPALCQPLRDLCRACGRPRPREGAPRPADTECQCNRKEA